MANELLDLEEKGLVFTKMIIHKICKLNDGEIQRTEQHEIIITDKDPSIIEVDVIII